MEQIEVYQKKTLAEDFWNDRQQAQETLKAISDLQEDVDRFKALWERAEYIGDLLEMAEAEEDEALWQEISRELEDLEGEFEEFELMVLFSSPHDDRNAIVAMHAGAGGTEAQDWVEMLFRMYTRWADAGGYEVEILDYLAGDEAGIKSVTFLVKGKHAYGKLKCEEGVHRLILISPFDSSGRRHTSFASLSVLPEIMENVEVTINPEELRIDTYRSGGAGGQHVNKTDSAVRIPPSTGVGCKCQNNAPSMPTAWGHEILTARNEVYQKEMADKLQNLKGEYKEIAWGSQIRTYTLNPFTLVKDHRTGVEVGNAQAVLDGELDGFMVACLQQKAYNAPDG